MLVSALVKQVLSGDTLIALGAQGATLSLTLTGLKAPRFPQQPKPNSQPSSVAADEPFGVESREFLRNLVGVRGKICFQIDHRDPANTEHVWVTLWTGTERLSLEESVNAQVARAGWAKLKDLDLKQHPELDLVLRRAQSMAESKSGIWRNPALAQRIYWDFPAGEFEEYAAKLQRQGSARALIEYCRDACSFRVHLLDSHIMLWFTLAGVMAARRPVTNLVATETVVLQEDVLAAEARRFSETRLLQREIVLEIGGFDSGNRIVYGRIVHPSGKCITQELVKNGLAKVVDWSIAYLPQPAEASVLRALQREAQAAQRGVWKDFVSKQQQAQQQQQSNAGAIARDEFDGVVTEVLSGDTMLVRIAGRGEERRVSLAWVQAPRLFPASRSTAQQEVAPPQDERFARESREFVRQTFQGARVHVRVEYVRESANAAQQQQQTPPPRAFATVTVQQTGVSIAHELCARGLCTVVNATAMHDQGSNNDELLLAQAEAKRNKLGLFSNDTPARITRLHFGSDAAKSRAHLPHLMRGGDGGLHACTVEWVASATRMGLDLPQENCLLTSFGVNGITVPLTKSNKRNLTQTDEPFAREALEFCRSQVFTPNLKVRIEGTDRTGCFLGSLFIRGEFNLAFLLLERGLAKVHAYSAENTMYKQELYARELKAKTARLGVWKDWVEVPEEEEASCDAEELKFRECVVSDVVSGDRLFIQYVDAPNQRNVLARVERELEQIQRGGDVGSPLKKNQLVAALFDDGRAEKWYRARVLGYNAQLELAHVFFIDFGNEDSEVGMDRIAPLPASLAALPALALEKRLAFCRARADLAREEYAKDAALFLHNFAFGGADATEFFACDTKFGLLLRRGREEEEDGNAELVNEEMVRRGLAFLRQRDKERLTPNTPLHEVYLRIKRAQAEARESRRAMWRFGDPGDEDLE